MSIGVGSVKRMIGSGESLWQILSYWFPEAISQIIFISLPPLLDSYIVASLGSTATYGALGTANNFLHTLLKFAEAIPVAAIAIIGRHNGAKEYEKVGQDLGDTFWTVTFLGFVQLLLIFFGASTIYGILGVPTEMVAIGVPFLRLRSFSIFLVFLSIAFIGFMKGVKNTKTPMTISVIGVFIFMFFDYALVFGRFGFPRLGLNGSAIASIIQYTVVISLATWYILSNPDYKKYFSCMFYRYFSFPQIVRLLNLSWPIMIDKTSLAISYVWLFKLIAPLGAPAITSFDAIKNLERFALIPAIAFAQIIVFLVSNRLGEDDPEGAKSNIKKVLILASIMVAVALLFLCLNANYFVGLFDPNHEFTHIAAPALVIVSSLVVFDFVQLILAGALRGAGDVRTVMWVRFFSCLFFFTPLAYFFSKLPIESLSLKFALLYSTFYFNTAVMGFVFMKRIIGKKWQKISI